MRPDGIIRQRYVFVLSLGFLAGAGQSVFAQGNAFDPFGNATNPYQPFVYPSAPSNFALPGAARNEMDAERGVGSRYNQFDRAMNPDRFSDDSNAARRGNGIGIPYTQAYRQLDRAAGRLDSPNERVDKSYYEGQQERYQRYLEAMREKDPKKRAQLLKEVNSQIAKAGRDTSFDKKPAPKTATPTPKAKSSAARGPSSLLDPLGPIGGSAGRRTIVPAPKPTTVRPNADRPAPEPEPIDRSNPENARRAGRRTGSPASQPSTLLTAPLASDSVVKVPTSRPSPP